MTRGWVVVPLVSVALSACGQSLPRFPKALFGQIAHRCNFQGTTYEETHTLLLDSALIDFSREANPKAAHSCFDATYDKISKEVMTGPNPPETFGYVWDTRA